MAIDDDPDDLIELVPGSRADSSTVRLDSGQSPLRPQATITDSPAYQVGPGAPYVAKVDDSTGTPIEVLPPHFVLDVTSTPARATLWLPPLFPGAGGAVYGAYKAKKDGRIRIGPFIVNGGGAKEPPVKEGDPKPPKKPEVFKTQEEIDAYTTELWKYILGRWNDYYKDYLLTCTFTKDDKPVATGVDITAAFSTVKEPKSDPKGSGKTGNHPSSGIDASKLQDALAAAKDPPPEWNDIEDIVFKKKPGVPPGGDKPDKIPVTGDDGKPAKFIFPGHKDKDGKDDYDKGEDNPNDKNSPDDPDPAKRPKNK